jgi:glutathione S-transferase
MRLYDGGRVPNARRVRIFLAEKGIEVSKILVDIGRRENFAPEFARLNPLRQVPVLEFDDGSILTESVAICRYFELMHPVPPLFGRGAREVADIEMWHRRIEIGLYLFVQDAFRHGHPAMTEYQVPQVPAWADYARSRALEALQLIDQHLQGREFVAAEGYSVADILLLVTLDFLKPAKINMPEELQALRAWHARASERPSSAA